MAKHSGPPPGYVDVQDRIVEFRAKYPEGTLQSHILTEYTNDERVTVQAFAYRTPDDPRPGSGLASEPVPGKTNFTRDSELMNAETSAWGRALIAVGAADAKRGIASANEVRNRQQSPDPVDLSALEDAITVAQDLGVEKTADEWRGFREYAGQSQAHADKALSKLKDAMDKAGDQ